MFVVKQIKNFFNLCIYYFFILLIKMVYLSTGAENPRPELLICPSMHGVHILFAYLVKKQFSCLFGMLVMSLVVQA